MLDFKCSIPKCESAKVAVELNRDDDLIAKCTVCGNIELIYIDGEIN